MHHRRRPALLLLAAVTAVLLSACGSSGTDGPATVATTGPAATDLAVPTTTQLVGSWAVFVVPQDPGPSERQVTFTETELSTSDNCNSASSGYTLGADGAFAIGEVAMTTAVCAAAGDARHIDALKSAARVGLDDRSGFDQLVLTDASGSIVLVLQRDTAVPSG
jgi:heat shock protein HslJ